MRWILICATLLIASSEGRGEFEVTWYSVDCGGGVSADREFQLFGTVGQSDTGVSASGTTTVIGGFMAGVCPPVCVDVTGDREVSVEDLVVIVLNWGCTVPRSCGGDINRDGRVDVDDLVTAICNWGACAP